LRACSSDPARLREWMYAYAQDLYPPPMTHLYPPPMIHMHPPPHCICSRPVWCVFTCARAQEHLHCTCTRRALHLVWRRIHVCHRRRIHVQCRCS
jgi:hypothetical protein